MTKLVFATILCALVQLVAGQQQPPTGWQSPAIDQNAEFIMAYTNAPFETLMALKQKYIFVDPIYVQLTPDQLNQLAQSGKIVSATIWTLTTANKENKDVLFYKPYLGSQEVYWAKYWEEAWLQHRLDSIRKYINAGYKGISLKDADGFVEYLAERPNARKEVQALGRRLMAEAQESLLVQLFLENSAVLSDLPEALTVSGHVITNLWSTSPNATASYADYIRNVKKLYSPGQQLFANVPVKTEAVACRFYQDCYAQDVYCATFSPAYNGDLVGCSTISKPVYVVKQTTAF